MVDIRAAWLAVYNLINGNVTDPESRSVKWIYGAWPSEDAITENGYPIIVIFPPQITMPKKTHGGLYVKDYTFSIGVYTSDIGATNGKGAQQLSTLTNTVLGALVANTDDLRTAGLHKMSLNTPSTPTVDLMDGWKRHRQRFIFTFRGVE